MTEPTHGQTFNADGELISPYRESVPGFRPLDVPDESVRLVRELYDTGRHGGLINATAEARSIAAPITANLLSSLAATIERDLTYGSHRHLVAAHVRTVATRVYPTDGA